ncbi:hypothetical protein, partial [Escherichia coli]|uniref:hypothetical protein n=1 Tax=Escherichia coli TaxID=562 RepID=UPI001BFD23A4
VVSRPATCNDVISGRRRTRFLNALQTGFPAPPATLHYLAINCVNDHRNRLGSTPEPGHTPLECIDFSHYAIASIIMLSVKKLT